MITFPKHCFYKDSVYRFFAQGISSYSTFDIEDLTIYDVDRIVDTACEVLALAETEYSITNDAIPLACWSVLLNLINEDEAYEDLISDTCNGFASYLNSESFAKLISADCDNCYPEGLYESCMKSIFLIQDRIDNPTPLLNTVISKSSHAVH